MLHSICFISIFLIQNVLTIDPLVQTRYGTIRGVNAKNGDYAMFLGIPYAKVNESNPFGASIPPGDFEDVFIAHNESTKCPQTASGTYEPSGSLDCLTVNVYKQSSANSTNKLPVMVFIHGGFHQRGDASRSSYGPKFLLKHDIILVTVNYRVGIYGFMCLDIPEVPGNQGIKDQITAFKWVKENIESFGGDPESITAFGNSAGARSLDVLITFSKEKLFHKCILESASALTPMMFVKANVPNVIEVTKQLGLTTEDVKDALQYLATADPIEVVRESAIIGYQYYPCVEKQNDNTDNFMTEYPFNVDLPKENEIPIMLGNSDDELLVGYHNLDSESYKTLDFFHDNLKNTFDFDNHTLSEMEALVRHFYIGDEHISIDQVRGIADFQSDYYYIYPVMRSVQKFLDNDYQNVYHYLFSYVGERNYNRVTSNMTMIGGAVHADELGYLFDMAVLDEDVIPEDLVMVDRMTTMWTNFAKYGQPTPETSELLPVKWERVTKEVLNSYRIDSELSLQRRPLNKRMTFWDLFWAMNEMKLIGYNKSAIL